MNVRIKKRPGNGSWAVRDGMKSQFDLLPGLSGHVEPPAKKIEKEQKWQLKIKSPDLKVKPVNVKTRKPSLACFNWVN